MCCVWLDVIADILSTVKFRTPFNIWKQRADLFGFVQKLDFSLAALGLWFWPADIELKHIHQDSAHVVKAKIFNI